MQLQLWKCTESNVFLTPRASTTANTVSRNIFDDYLWKEYDLPQYKIFCLIVWKIIKTECHGVRTFLLAVSHGANTCFRRCLPWSVNFLSDNFHLHRPHAPNKFCLVPKHTKFLEPPHDKTNKWHMRPAKTQISLGIRPVWSEYSLCAQWLAKDPSFLHTDSEDWSDWADAQADLSLRWAHMPFGWFCNEAVHINL